MEIRKNIFSKCICIAVLIAMTGASLSGCGRSADHASVASQASSPSRTDCRYQRQVAETADFILSLQCANGAIRDCKGADTVNTDSNMEYALIGLGSAYELTADRKYLDGVKKGISWLAARECMSGEKWKGSFWYQYDTDGNHLPCEESKNVLDVRGVDTTSALFVYLLYMDHRMDPDSDLTARYRDNAVSALEFIRNNNLDTDHLSRSSWQKDSHGNWTLYDCKYSADQGDVYLGFCAAGKLYHLDTYRTLAAQIRTATEEKLYDDSLGRYCTGIEDHETDKQLNSFDPIQSQGFLPWIFGSDAVNRHAVSWLLSRVQPDGSISCYQDDPGYALSIAVLGMGENAVNGRQPAASYQWLGMHLSDAETGGIYDSSESAEEDCNVAGLCLIALTRMLPFEQPMMYGVTLNDITAVSVSEVIKGLDAMEQKPTVRVVMRPELSAASYKDILKSLHEHAYIMLCPCDSSYLKDYKSADRYVDRYRECVDALSPYVDIWETGNEINGEGWTGLSSEEASEYMYSAWKYLYSMGMTTELTPYEFRHGDQSTDMIPWLKKYVPQQMRDHLDHVLISYYDDDNDGVHDDWQSVFDQLAVIFPDSRIGFGECGFSEPHAYDKAFAQQVTAYYGLKPFNDHYEGGYFWWYWQQDCLPCEDNQAWKMIASYVTAGSSR